MTAVRDRIRARRLERLLAHRDLDAAIALLTEDNRRNPDPARERHLLRLRNEAFHELTRRSSSGSTIGGPRSWPPPHSDRFAGIDGVPELAANDLDADALRAGVFGRGAIVARGLLDAAQVSLLADSVDRAFAGYDRSSHGKRVNTDDPWFAPFDISDVAPADHPRRWIRAGGGVYAAESPRAMFHVLEVIQQSGVARLVEKYFEERAALSVLKTTLRIVEPDASIAAGWHQDGAFLGQGIRSLNLWIALTACGRDAPGLQMIPRRLDHVVGAGDGNAAFSWSVDSDQIDVLTGGAGPTWLEFEAGDVVFFDELNLHSTATRPGMVKSRKAVEAWFFSASHYPLDRIPLLV
ncbi:hypothetical protein BH23ACT3_BH23ACT3_01350 [soil metagenome]